MAVGFPGARTWRTPLHLPFSRPRYLLGRLLTAHTCPQGSPWPRSRQEALAKKSRGWPGEGAAGKESHQVLGGAVLQITDDDDDDFEFALPKANQEALHAGDGIEACRAV